MKGSWARLRNQGLRPELRVHGRILDRVTCQVAVWDRHPVHSGQDARERGRTSVLASGLSHPVSFLTYLS